MQIASNCDIGMQAQVMRCLVTMTARPTPGLELRSAVHWQTNLVRCVPSHLKHAPLQALQGQGLRHGKRAQHSEAAQHSSALQQPCGGTGPEHPGRPPTLAGSCAWEQLRWHRRLVVLSSMLRSLTWTSMHRDHIWRTPCVTFFCTTRAIQKWHRSCVLQHWCARPRLS